MAGDPRANNAFVLTISFAARLMDRGIGVFRATMLLIVSESRGVWGVVHVAS